jgi:hypothetical protein
MATAGPGTTAGTISFGWSAAGTLNCPACNLSATVNTCTCTLAVSGNTQVTVTTP